MLKKIIIGVVALVAGVSSLIISNYITQQVNDGKEQIEDGQGKVDMGKKLFSITPQTKEIGKGLTDSAQKKIDAGKELVAKYESLASVLYTGGILVSLIGAFLIFLGIKKKSGK